MTGRPYNIAPLPGYSEPYGSLLAAIQDGTREWREELGNPEPNVIAWQPVPKGHSIGAVLLHMAEAETYWIDRVCLGRPADPELAKLHMSDEIDPEAASWPTPPEEPITYYYEILDRVRARTLESVMSFPPADTVLPHHGDTVTLGWVLAHLIEHDSYHGGQAVLLKEMGKHLMG